MTDDEKSREPLTLKRWSARKHAANAPANAGTEPATLPQPPAASNAAIDQPTAAPEAPALPPVDSLTFDSDFARFLKPDVDETLKRAALKKLLHDPRFNVMDGLDVYIDDYSKPDPIEPDVVRQLAQARYLFDPPKTRVTKEGFVEDVPPAVEAPKEDEDAPAPPAIAHDDVGAGVAPDPAAENRERAKQKKSE